MTRCRLLSVLSGVLFAIAATAAHAAAQGPEPIRYTLTFPAPQTHYVEVEAVVPTGRKPDVDLMMATWTPGSYLMREYARHVENVKARAGANAGTNAGRSSARTTRIRPCTARPRSNPPRTRR